MSQLRVASPNRRKTLYRLIGYEPGLEARGFRRLAEVDVDRCRAAFGRLVDRLDFSGLGANGREAILLLLDVLQRVNRRIHRPSTDETAYQRNRLALLEQFSSYDNPDDARAGFVRGLNRLLTPLTSRRAAAHPLVVRAQSFIDEHYQRRVSLSSVAAQLHVSANYLSRLFRRETGITLTAYIQRVRLEHAMVLLAEGERSISEIAYLIGYQNYRDFYRNFVKYANASPRQVQRRLSPDAGR